MMTDQALLDSMPSYLMISDMLKATPVTEGGVRFVYIEASNESLDQQNEVVASKALAESADYFKQFGNLDIDHFTQIGAKMGIPDYESYEIGRPVEVKIREGKTFVKGQIFAGNGPAAERANRFWSSLVDINPPARWYPSVGGAVLSKSVSIDPETKAKRAIIEKVRWTNIGFSKTPVNAQVPTVSTVPMDALAKSWMGAGFDLSKALEAGYGTDSATLTGGAALRTQSLYGTPISYFDFREKLAAAMRAGIAGVPIGAHDLARYAANAFGLMPDEAAEYVERFMRDVKNGLSNKRGKK